MKYTIDNLSDLEIIKLNVRDSVTSLERFEVIFKAISELRKNGYHRLLCDIKNSYEDEGHKFKDPIDMAEYMKNIKKPKNTKLALLGSDIERPHENLSILIKIIKENMNFRHFTNYDEAIKWLCEEEIKK